MTALTDTVPTRSAFAALVRAEARLLLREPLTLFWGVAFPVVLLVVMGSFGSRPDPALGGARLVDVYAPVLIAFTTAARISSLYQPYVRPSVAGLAAR